MASKLLKLDPPYSVILAGTTVGLHMATLIKWNDDDVTDNESYPIVAEGEETPDGTLCPVDIVRPRARLTSAGWPRSSSTTFSSWSPLASIISCRDCFCWA